MNKPHSAPVSAREFFAKDLPGGRKTDAHAATRIAYSTLCDIASGLSTQPRKETLKRLERWSRTVSDEFHISVALSLGFAEPAALPATGTGR